MAFIATRMPEKIVSGFLIGPRWQTQVVPMDNGREQRNAEWLYPKYEARANMGAYDSTTRASIRNMYMACRGKLHAFRVKDPLDYTASAQPLVTVGGVTYLSKAYTFGTETASRLIQAPVTAALSGAGSVDLTTGIVTGANAAVDTWTGTFDIWMRFDTDWNAVSAKTTDIWDIELELIEVRR